MDNVQALEEQILQSMMTRDVTSPYPINDFIEIDAETRSINIPSTEFIFGVKRDQDAERKYFRCPKIVGDNHDLSKLGLRVHYENANQEKDKYIVNDVVVDGDYITFSWLLSAKVLKYIGSVNFAICAVRVDDSGELKIAWNTTLGTGAVLTGLEVDDLTEDEEMEGRDVLQQLLNTMETEANDNIQDVKDEGATQVSNVQNEAATQLASMKNEGASQVENIETVGQNVLATIPDDYTSMSEQVGWNSRYLAPTVEQVAEGEVVRVSDSADMPLIGLNVYGKSEQVKTTGAQLIPYPFFVNSNNSNGIAWVANEDGSVSASGTSTDISRLYITNSQHVMEAGTYTISGSTDDIAVRIDSADADTGAWVAGVGISTKGVPVTFTLTEDDVANYTYTIYASIENGHTVNTVIYPMINTGTEALSFEPYTGGKPAPNPDYPQEIVSVSNPTSHIYGKNLANIDEGLNDQFIKNDDGTYTIRRSNGYRFSNFIPIHIPANTPITTTVYEIHSDGYPNIYLQYVAEGNEPTKGVQLSSEITSRTITCDFDVVKLRVYMPPDAVDGDYKTFGGIQTEIGITSTEFEAPKNKQALLTPYTLNAVPVTSGGNYTDPTGQQYICDEVDFERGVYIQRTKLIDFSSWTDWYTWGVSANTEDITGFHHYVDDQFTHYEVLSNVGSCNNLVWGGKQVGVAAATSDSKYIMMSVKNEDLADTSSDEAAIASFIDVISTSSAKMLCCIEPIETPLNAEELEVFKALRTNYPNTTITNDAGAIQKVAYATDTKLYIDNKFAELLSKLT